LPVIPKVVDVFETGADAIDDPVERHGSLVDHLALVECIVRVRNAVGAPPDDKVVEVVVLPIEQRRIWAPSDSGSSTGWCSMVRVSDPRLTSFEIIATQSKYANRF
jgi:hypothetical protein